jgi:hypothetical protein
MRQASLEEFEFPSGRAWAGDDAMVTAAAVAGARDGGS